MVTIIQKINKNQDVKNLYGRFFFYRSSDFQTEIQKLVWKMNYSERSVMQGKENSSIQPG
jgi:hypothetical protein